jgi:chromate transporter
MSKDPAMSNPLREIALTSLKLGSIGFGGIAGMISTIEEELVIKRKWIDHEHFMDVLSASYIIPGPNAVEIMMHCGKERGGRLGLIIAGVCYILPATLICIIFAFFYKQYSAVPDVQRFISGMRPATTALIIGTLFRLGVTLRKSWKLVLICISIFIGGLAGINEVILILSAGLLNYILNLSKDKLITIVPLMLVPVLADSASKFSNSKLFFIFLKIGAILYGSGYVLFAYMDGAFVRSNHWLTTQQLTDAIAIGQLTPGPILSSATFAGYLMNGTQGAVLATTAIFLPSFFISFFLHKLLSSARKSTALRFFLDGLSAASIAIIGIVGLNLAKVSLAHWKSSLILVICFLLITFVKRTNSVMVIFIGGLLGYVLVLL